MPDPHRRLEVVRAYHRATCHDLHRYARGPGELDWATQPEPFRRYAGAPLIALDHVPLDEGPRYADVLGRGAVEPARVDRRSVSRLFLDSLALSAWKQYGSSTWALRVNPSSGNLHPTEVHLVCGPVEGLCTVPMLAHYAPREHALEARAELAREGFDELARGCPEGTFFVGLASIHWREAWKYGERAYRYCQHDAGHALAALDVAARALGWSVHLCDDLGREDLAALLGLGDARGAEPEEPDVLVAIVPRGEVGELALPGVLPASWGRPALVGLPNALSPDHVEWGAIDAVAEAAAKPRTSAAYGDEARPAPFDDEAFLPRGELALRAVVHRRRSAVDFDGKTSIARDDLYRVLGATARLPIGLLPWRPRVHLGLFVHRVRDLEPGIYCLVRDASQKPLLQAAMERPFAWEKPAGCPPSLELYRLHAGDLRAHARAVSCHQEIAADGAFSLGMIAELAPSLERHGAWFYPRLYWECGAIGQVLYLEAEAIGVRGTGIGCFFDEPVHQLFGLSSERWRSLYHFTIGGPVDDARLQSWPAYPPRG